MNIRIILITLVSFAFVIVYGCTNLRDDLPPSASGETEVHGPGWDDTSAVNFHGKYLRSNLYPLALCQKCHGTSYAGAPRAENVSCSSSGCHADASGAPKLPEACNTCHGGFRATANDTVSWAPPPSLAGDTAETSPGVGAHQPHLTHEDLASVVTCDQCHQLPATVQSPGHIDTTVGAELVFNRQRAALITGDSTFIPDARFDAATLRCSNIFCHGSWKLRRATSPNQFGFQDSVMVGNSYSPLWTGTDSEAECGTCHGLPPTGHQNFGGATGCVNCHSGVVDNAGNISGPSLHINGKVNVFGQQRDF